MPAEVRSTKSSSAGCTSTANGSPLWPASRRSHARAAYSGAAARSVAAAVQREPCCFLTAQSAARWNAPLRVFYERLVGRGKPKKAPLAAVANKS